MAPTVKSGRGRSIEDVKRAHEDELMALPNVKGVGIGERAGKSVIVVFVSHKVPASALRPKDVVPARLEGFEVDVQEIGVPQAQ